MVLSGQGSSVRVHEGFLTPSKLYPSPSSPPTKHAQYVWAHPKARPRDQKKQYSTYHPDDGSETASDADRPAGRSLRKTPSSE